jgi:hypothetical protein
MKKTTVTLIAIMLLGILTVSAFGGFGFGNKEEINNALENNDFDAWKTAMTQQLTEENFNKMVERHQKRAEFREHKEEIHAAIEAGDYETWSSLIEETPMADKFDVITAENFDLFAEMHNARLDGDHETAQEIADSLGLECQGGRMKGHRFRMRE